MTYRIGIIGVGGRGAHTARALIEDPKKRGDIIALCDLNPAAMESYETHVMKYFNHGCKKFTDYKELLADPEIDVVMINTPDQFHHEMALAAFDAKKHVFLEKPVGINFDQMIDIIRAAKTAKDKYGKILEIGYVLRYAPFYYKIKEYLSNGAIGRPLFATMLEQYYGGAGVFFRNWWRLRKNVGGVMIQKICHDSDLAYWFFGKPKFISAFESNMEFKPSNWNSDAKFCSECKNPCPYFIKPDPKRNHVDFCLYNTDKTGADISDNAQVTIQFESGLNLTLGMNFFCSIGQTGRNIRIVGSKADLTGNLEEQILRVDPRHDFSGSKSYYLETAETSLGGHGGGDAVQIWAFLDGLSQGKEAKAGIESAYWSSIIVMGAQISADEHRTVSVSELTKKYPFPD